MTQQITAQLLKGGLTVDASGNITTAGFNQKTSINLSGTYSTHQLLVADAYALTGDVTVNDNLILGKLSDDGNDILIEGSYTFTTTGSGKVEVGYIIT